MLSLSPLVALELQYTDRSGRVAQVRQRYPSSVSVDTLISIGTSLIGAIEPVTSAACTGFAIRYTLKESEPIEAVEGCDAAEAAALFYRNGEDYDAFFIPAPLPQLWETVGPYASYRVDTSNPAVVSLVGQLNLALAAPAGWVFLDVGGEWVNGGRAI
jgi:hypothetical protein